MPYRRTREAIRGELVVDARLIARELARLDEFVEQARAALVNARERLEAAKREPDPDPEALRDLEEWVESAQQTVQRAVRERFAYEVEIRTLLGREIRELQAWINHLEDARGQAEGEDLARLNREIERAEARLDELLGLVKIVGW